MNKMQRGEMGEFESCFTFSCPKFLSPVPPAYDAVTFDSDALHKEPLKLQLKATDIAKHRIGSIDFKPAKFNNFCANGEESTIVTSTGKFLITWNFKKVKRGVLNEYQIKALEVKPGRLVKPATRS